MRLALLCVAALALVACAGGGAATTSGVRGAQKTTAKRVGFVRVAGGFRSPTDVVAAPGDAKTLYVVEQPGRVRIVRGGRVRGTFLDIRGRVSFGGEQGLLSIAFSPNYPSDHRFYVSYTNTGGDSRVVGYRARNGRAVPSSARVLLAVHQPYANHNGGQLQFDRRGYLWIGFGDGGSEGDPRQASQNLNLRLGKLFRATTKTPNGHWKRVGLGLRNPWRFSFDRKTGDLWIGDVGQNAWEEVDFRPHTALDRLANYGWSRYEGNSVYDANHRYANVGVRVKPVLVYSHAHGCSITGGYVYRGSAVPAERGRYVYGDYCTGTVWSFRVGPRGRASSPVAIGHVPSLSAFGEDGNGELYATSLDGTLYRLRQG
ncbi:MAG TPA: PQQ-dependent sugar dehydrogenase [Gaiellaceae bacterium]|nr:PQQ-dependent sugar dehydrogenase [Gaiellaceae bacterium]